MTRSVRTVGPGGAGEPAGGVELPGPLVRSPLRGLCRQPQLHGLDAALEPLDLGDLGAQLGRAESVVGEAVHHRVHLAVGCPQERVEARGEVDGVPRSGQVDEAQ